jgi:hypothetical protein
MDTILLKSPRYCTSFRMFRTSLAHHQVAHGYTKQLNVLCCSGKRLAPVLWVTEFFNERNGECGKKRESRSFVCLLSLTFFTQL